jgi:hypothetical protein
MALVVYALSKNTGLANRLVSITNPIKLAAEVAKIEKEIKVRKKSNAGKIVPEGTLKGNATGAVATSKVDKQLAKLEKEARETGDRTLVAKFKRENNIK